MTTLTPMLTEYRRYDRIAAYCGLSVDTIRRASDHKILCANIEQHYSKLADLASKQLHCSRAFIDQNSTRRRWHYIAAKGDDGHKPMLRDFADYAFIREMQDDPDMVRQWRGFVSAALFCAAYIPWLYWSEFLDETDVNNPIQQMWITRSEASRTFRVSERALYESEHGRRAETIHIGGSVLHRVDDLAARYRRR